MMQEGILTCYLSHELVMVYDLPAARLRQHTQRMIGAVPAAPIAMM